MQDLVIVESPTKARTLSRFLGKNYKIEASMGHIRDLPKSEMGIDLEHNFEPKYIIPRDKRKRVNELKKLADNAKVIYLATDPDREGEAIAWHIQNILSDSNVKNKKSKKDGLDEKKVRPDDSAEKNFKIDSAKSESVRFKRVVFHEITEEAIKEAFNDPRVLDVNLIDAQQARRVLDRLVGYKLSPLLWKKVKRGLSAGRVQTVALRLIVEREREILAFVPIEYWSIDANLENNEKQNFNASLIEKNGEKLEIKNESESKALVSDLENAQYSVQKITQREIKKSPAPPFTTSTLQQAAGNKLGFTSKKTMMIAQNLYESGLITYMRTDSVNLSTFALNMARDYIKAKFGANFLPKEGRVFKSKSKNAQEAHEAIRPTNLKLTADNLKADNFTRDHKRLYELIWKRMVASQMLEAIMDQTSINIEALGTEKYLLRASGSVLKFEGWLKAYGVTSDKYDEEEEDDDKKQILPKLSENEKLNLLNLLPEQHFTQPPPRYSEASLVKKLEELGIGRPSTYAPILSTLQERYYVERTDRRFFPTPLGLAVSDFLIKYFPKVFDYNFTASMEDELDDVSRGERGWQETIGKFYSPLEETLEETEEKAEKVKLEVETTDKICPECGKNLVVRTGKFGKFLACSGFPECKYTESFEQVVDAKCPNDGGEVVLRKTKKGKTFYGCKNWPKCTFAAWNKPK